MKYSYLSESVVIRKNSETETKGVFAIEGLYTGYGMTLGTALRRALLSSLPGAAITQIKVKGVDHEFSTMPGMVEDVLEFTLNLKKVRFDFFAEEPQVLTLHVKGERAVTALDIQTTPLVKVVNGDLHLANLTKKNAELDIELTVEKGLGYLPSEDRKLERLPIGTIVLDAVFSPVTRVEFSVENMRVGDRTDYNRLLLTIETDGTATPSSVLHKASNILSDHFEKIAAIDVLEAKSVAEKTSSGKKKRASK